MAHENSKGLNPKKSNNETPPKLPQEETPAVKVEACGIPEVEPKIPPTSFTSPPTTPSKDAIPPAEIEAGRATPALDGPCSEAATSPPEESGGYPLGEGEPLPAAASKLLEPSLLPEAFSGPLLQSEHQIQKEFEQSLEQQYQTITGLQVELKGKDEEIARLEKRLEGVEARLEQVRGYLCWREDLSPGGAGMVASGNQAAHEYTIEEGEKHAGEDRPAFKYYLDYMRRHQYPEEAKIGEASRNLPRDWQSGI